MTCVMASPPSVLREREWPRSPERGKTFGHPAWLRMSAEAWARAVAMIGTEAWISLNIEGYAGVHFVGGGERDQQGGLDPRAPEGVDALGIPGEHVVFLVVDLQAP